MTIILAARNSGEIITCYDTVEYHSPYQSVYPRERPVHKVRPIGDGKVIMGFAGNIEDWGVAGDVTCLSHGIDKIFSKFDERLKAANGDSVQTLNELVAEDRIPLLNDLKTIEECGGGSNWTDSMRRTIADMCYLFGIVQGDKTMVLVSDRWCDSELRDESCYGIGCGMYSEVRQMLKDGYEPHMKSETLIVHLRRVMDLAKQINVGRKEKIRFKGLGIGRLSSQGFEELHFSTD